MSGYRIKQGSNTGASLLYVLGALIVVGFVGSSMIKMVTSDKISRAYYSTSSSARSAAKSGMISAINYLREHEDETLERLQRWTNLSTRELLFKAYPDDQWVCGSGSSRVTLDDQMSYRTKIVSFDVSTFNITLLSEGHGNGGARAHMTTVYNLGGIGYEKIERMVPRHAIQLDGNDNFEMNCSLVVHGPSYFGGKIVTYNKGAIFDGDVHMKENNSVSYLSRGVNFKKRAYLGGHVKLGINPSTFQGVTGFAKSLKVDNLQGMPRITSNVGDVYHNGVKMNEYPRASTALPWGKNIDMNGANVHYRDGFYTNGSTNSTDFTALCSDLGPDSKKYFNEIDIREKMGFGDVSSIPFDTSVLENVSVYEMSNGEQMTAQEMNSRYQTALANGDTLNGKFMVMRAPKTGTGNLFGTHTSSFTGRVLWIMVNPNLNLENFYESTTSANSILYIHLNNQVPMADFNYLRGIVYVAGNLLIMNVRDTYIEGSVYHKAGAMHKYENSGGTQLLDITYSDDVINEAALTGIFDEESDEVTELILLDSVKGITVSFVSQSM